MALTGLQIFKLLPNKNCNECGVPTCLAFAMKLAAKSAELDLCPHIAPESLEVLGASQTPPIKKLDFAAGTQKFTAGAETVMYRHEKTFCNQTLIALEVHDDLADTEFNKKIEEIKSYSFDRVGEILSPECISLLNTSNNTANYITKYKAIKDLDKIVILSNINPGIMREILAIENNHSKLIINSLTAATINDFKETLSGKDIKIVLEAKNLDSLFDLVGLAEAAGLKNLTLRTTSGSIADLLEENVSLRRLALKKHFKPAGYPLLTECGNNIFTGITGICKYSSIIIIKDYDGASLFPLLTLRQNIYTDPQKPLQLKPGIYKVGEPSPDSPLIVTTNFSLTYFIVSGEIEGSPYNSRLLITDSEGMSVLTAWSANKFSAKLIADSVINSEVEKEISHKKVIIPGYVSILQGELEDELKDWEVLVGPQEAADIPQYLKETWK